MILEELSSQNFISSMGKVVKTVRLEQNLSLEELAKRTGVSRLTLAKIEHGDANPSINIMWKICNTLSIQFTDLFDVNEEIVMSKASESQGIEADDKSFRIEFMFREESKSPTEFFRIYLSKSKSILTEKHNKGCVEVATVMRGKVLIKVEDEEFILNEFDSLKFNADKNHEYKNISDGEAVINTSVIYNK
ncbi:XRE family transcriptional regulator [uncultured Clostridium sp.]|jgi:transcriptional regulator with XRE-family HTH domain|uniref:helix-turn-helix domain-containing protein n=1 Tax=uncultured Clostridium sp. TaxID=59620 RepID=UPI00262AFF30|nr:XRE family transcriptional regulator [uncultured Clostridium sp.]